MTEKRWFGYIVVFYCVFGVGCDGDSAASTEPDASAFPPPAIVPAGMDTAAIALLSERVESEHFVFFHAPGDRVWPDRQDVFHRWAIQYLDVGVAGKITYFKFATPEDMEAAIGQRGGGRAYPWALSVATVHSWHPHEAFHIYGALLCQQGTIRLYNEGLVVAHEFDPLNENWVSQWNRRELDEPYIYAEQILEHRAAGILYPIEDILESEDFNRISREHGSRVLYDEAGMFVDYLIDQHGLDTMKEAYCSVEYEDNRETIKERFADVFGITVGDAEQAWLAYLDASM